MVEYSKIINPQEVEKMHHRQLVVTNRNDIDEAAQEKSGITLAINGIDHTVHALARVIYCAKDRIYLALNASCSDNRAAFESQEVRDALINAAKKCVSVNIVIFQIGEFSVDGSKTISALRKCGGVINIRVDVEGHLKYKTSFCVADNVGLMKTLTTYRDEATQKQHTYAVFFVEKVTRRIPAYYRLLKRFFKCWTVSTPV